MAKKGLFRRPRSTPPKAWVGLACLRSAQLFLKPHIGLIKPARWLQQNQRSGLFDQPQLKKRGWGASSLVVFSGKELQGRGNNISSTNA